VGHRNARRKLRNWRGAFTALLFARVNFPLFSIGELSG
jgi:hypothetical protein